MDRCIVEDQLIRAVAYLAECGDLPIADYNQGLVIAHRLNLDDRQIEIAADLCRRHRWQLDCVLLPVPTDQEVAAVLAGSGAKQSVGC